MAPREHDADRWSEALTRFEELLVQRQEPGYLRDQSLRFLEECRAMCDEVRELVDLATRPELDLAAENGRLARRAAELEAEVARERERRERAEADLASAERAYQHERTAGQKRQRDLELLTDEEAYRRAIEESLEKRPER